jgi:Tfp pilus assembly protein PilN
MSKQNFLIIPRHLVTLRFIELPSTEPSEIIQMADFQALKQLPYTKEEIISSYRNLGSYKKGFSSLMLVIVKRQIVEQIMTEALAKPDIIVFETELFYLNLLRLGIPRQDKLVMAIEIHKDYSEIIALDNKRPIFSRGFKNEEFFEELERSMVAYEREKNIRDIDEVAIVHQSDLSIENIKQNIVGYFKIPINYYEYKQDPNIFRLPLEINLLPKELIERQFYKQSYKEILLTYMLLLVMLAMMVSFFLFKLHERDRFIAMFSDKADRIQAEVDTLNNFIKKIDALKSQNKAGGLIMDILNESYKLIPGDIILSGLNYDGKDAIYYKGVTGDMSSVFNFVKVLEKSQYFEKVEVKYATKKEAGNREITDFNIACRINPVR